MGTEPRTIQVGISGTSAVESYTLAPGLAQFVESVYVEIDNTAGGDAQPLVTLSDQSGVVIAKKRQGGTIAGGDTGSSTWALRLADETTQAANATVVAHVRFTASEIENGATKSLVSARVGTIILPLNYLLVPSNDFQPSVPLFILETPSYNWYTFTSQSFGVTQFANTDGWLTTPSTDGVPRSLAGEPLNLRVDPNATPPVTGTQEAFVLAQLMRLTT